MTTKAKTKAKRPKARSGTPKRPERSPRGSARALEAALALLAHEVRTPLNGILAFSELLSTADLGERERDWASAIKSAAQHLDLYTTLIVDSVKAGSRRIVLREEPFRPRGLAEAAAAVLTARAAAKGLTARIDIAGDLPEAVKGDPVRLRALLENLIDNAVKFTPSGEVGFALHAAPAAKGRVRLVFTVADHGIGLSRSELRRLFRPFAQANRNVARRFGGTGLGLSLTRRLAQAMGGKLAAESKPGHGSTFHLEVELERASQDRSLGKEASDSGSVASPRAMRILCAEDNPYGRVVLNTILTSLGHSVDFVSTGEDAVKAVGCVPYDLVVMDLTLPKLGGVEAARRIRALPAACGGVPIIGISGAAGEHAAAKAGMNDFLAKPVGAAALARAIARAIAS